jgi:hypothetical protein
MAASILPWTHHHCWRMDPAPTQSQAGRSPPKRQAVRRGNNVHLVLGSVHTPNNQDDRLISLMVEARQTNDLLLASRGIRSMQLLPAPATRASISHGSFAWPICDAGSLAKPRELSDKSASATSGRVRSPITGLGGA